MLVVNGRTGSLLSGGHMCSRQRSTKRCVPIYKQALFTWGHRQANFQIAFPTLVDVHCELSQDVTTWWLLQPFRFQAGCPISNDLSRAQSVGFTSFRESYIDGSSRLYKRLSSILRFTCLSCEACVWNRPVCWHYLYYMCEIQDYLPQRLVTV